MKIIVNGEKLKSFPLRSRTRQEWAILTNCIPHKFESPSYTNQRRKKKWNLIGKEEENVIVCTWHNAIHRKP